MHTTEAASVRSTHAIPAAPAPTSLPAPTRAAGGGLQEALRDPALPNDAWAKTLRPKLAPQAPAGCHHAHDSSATSPHTTPAGVQGLPAGFQAEKIGQDAAVVRAYANALIVRGKDGLTMVDTMMPTDFQGVKKTLDALCSLAEHCERVWDSPHDIEWAVHRERVWLLQRRPITSRP